MVSPPEENTLIIFTCAYVYVVNKMADVVNVSAKKRKTIFSQSLL